MDAEPLEMLVHGPRAPGLLPGALTGADDRAVTVVLRDKRMIVGQLRHVVRRRIQVDDLVRIVAEAVGRVINAAQREAAVEQIGKPEIQVQRVACAHGAAEGHKPRVALPAVLLIRVRADERHDLARDIVDPAFVLPDAAIRVAVPVAPGLDVDRVDRKDEDFPAVDPFGQGVRHAEVLEIVEPAVLAGNEQHRLARMSVDLHGHLAAEIVAVKIIIVHFHTVHPPVLTKPRSVTFPSFLYIISLRKQIRNIKVQGKRKRTADKEGPTFVKADSFLFLIDELCRRYMNYSFAA